MGYLALQSSEICHKKVTKLFIRILTLIFVCEVAVMAVLHMMNLKGITAILVDPLILAVLATPILCWFVISPIWGALEQRENADAALEASEERFRELADFLPQTVFELDIDANFTYSNRYGFESTGYAQEDIDQGLNALQLFSQEDQGRIRRNIVKLLAGEQINASEYTLKIKDGSLVPVLIYSRLIMHHGKPVGFRGIVVDISDRKQMEQALQNNIAELERFNKMAVGRELKMIELKREVNDLLAEIGREEKYHIANQPDIQDYS